MRGAAWLPGLIAVVLVLAAVTMPRPAPAQEPDRGVSVGQRPRPDFDPLGVRVGGFLLYPHIGLAERYDDNIFSDEDGEQDDFIAVVNPTAELRSDWNNHALNFIASVELGMYASSDDENYEDFAVAADGRVDILRSTFVTAGLSYAGLHEDRGSPDDVNGTEPTEFDALSPVVGFSHQFGRFVLNLDGTLNRLDFDDVATTGAAINNDDRDRDEWNGTARLGYEIIPAYQAFLEGSYGTRDYDDAFDDAGFDRDSEGFSVVAGTLLDLGGVTFGELFLGYRSQDYDDPALSTISGPIFGGEITWNVTQLTTVQGFATRTIEETTRVNASGFFATGLGATIDHQLLRNLLLGGNVSYANSDYEGIDRDDDVIRAGLHGRYLVHRSLYLSARYDYANRDSNVAGAGYDKNVIMVRLDAQL